MPHDWATGGSWSQFAAFKVNASIDCCLNNVMSARISICHGVTYHASISAQEGDGFEKILEADMDYGLLILCGVTGSLKFQVLRQCNIAMINSCWNRYHQYSQMVSQLSQAMVSDSFSFYQQP